MNNDRKNFKCVGFSPSSLHTDTPTLIHVLSLITPGNSYKQNRTLADVKIEVLQWHHLIAVIFSSHMKPNESLSAPNVELSLKTKSSLHSVRLKLPW